MRLGTGTLWSGVMLCKSCGEGLLWGPGSNPPPPSQAKRLQINRHGIALSLFQWWIFVLCFLLALPLVALIVGIGGYWYWRRQRRWNDLTWMEYYDPYGYAFAQACDSNGLLPRLNRVCWSVCDTLESLRAAGRGRAGH